MSVKGKARNKSVFRTTDKCIQAEMKNKVEVVRLQLQMKILDRQKSYSAFTVEKDKRQALNALARMRTTSGLSMHGVAPDGPADRTHEDSPYFKSYRPLTEKRLIRWRAKEKEVERMLQKEEDLLIPPWERDHDEDMSEKFGNMMRMLGYSIDDDDVRMLLKKVERTSDKVTNGNCRRETVDPFECLRKDCENDQVDNRVRFDLRKQQTFLVNAWSKRIIENYKQLVTNDGIKLRESESVTSQVEDHDSNVLETKSRLAWESSTSGTAKHKTTFTPHPPSTIVRPHTASGASRRRVMREALLRRPSSAGNTAETKRSTYRGRSPVGCRVSSGVKREGFGTVDKSERELCVTGKDNGKREDVSEQITLGERPHITEDASLRRTANHTLVQLSCSNKGEKEEEVDKKDVPTESEKTSNEPKIDCKMSARDSMFLINTLLNADKKQVTKPSKVSFSDDLSTTEAPPKTTKVVKSVQQLVKLSKDSAKFANYDIKVLEENLEDISGLKNNSQVHELFKKMPEHRERRKKDLHITKAERLIALHSRQYKELDPLDDVLNSDEDVSDSGTDIVRRMPQWKRELMAEAPPGLFGPRSPAKVVVAMSKAQRKRELDALVKENISDVRKIINQENARRIRDRLHVYFTVRKLNEAVEKVSAANERN